MEFEFLVIIQLKSVWFVTVYTSMQFLHKLANKRLQLCHFDCSFQMKNEEPNSVDYCILKFILKLILNFVDIPPILSRVYYSSFKDSFYLIQVHVDFLSDFLAFIF